MSLGHLNWPHQLRRKFRLVVFDWDGTAVEERERPAPDLARALSGLLKRGILLGLITGTKIDLLLRNCIEFLPAAERGGLFAFTNRGSEVWNFSNQGQPELSYRYEASAGEEQALDSVAAEFRKFAQEHGIQINVISNRLNRRKMDLIPEPEWENPAKSQIEDLQKAVRHRLAQSTLESGIGTLSRHARRLARQVGMTHPKITTDIKHLEVGLTDKADSVRWILENLVKPRDIAPEDLIVFGDEFGVPDELRGELPGSDALMQLPELENSVFCSVGVEPNGVPEGVISLRGGPARFRKFLSYQAEMAERGRNLFERPCIPTPDPTWLIEQEGFDPSREHEMESLFSIGNAYLGMRASSAIPIPSSQSEYYISGIYDRKAVGFPYSELEFKTAESRANLYSELVPFPSPFGIKVSANGTKLMPGATGMRSHERILDMKNGALFELYYFHDPQAGEVILRSMSMVSISDPHLLLHEVMIDVENAVHTLEIGLVPEISDFSLRYPHLKSTEVGTLHGTAVRSYKTSGSEFGTAIATKRSIDGIEQDDDSSTQSLTQRYTQSYTMKSLFSVFTSRDGKNPADLAAAHLASKPWNSFASEATKHSGVWKRFWEKSDFRFPDNPAITQAHRFGLYHLRNAAPVSEIASIGARGLTGRSYEGHVFWDTETFIFPFYLAMLPEAARNILLYRFRTLDGARARSKALGYRGACYAWESTVDGSDVTPSEIVLFEGKKRVPIFTGNQQIHVTADIAYAVTQYWDSTHDREFMKLHGLEMLLETARFWASRVSWQNGKYHILGVVGPDEYHHDVNDNAYTNWMARENVKAALNSVEWIRIEDRSFASGLLERLGVSTEEIESLKKLLECLYVPEPDSNGIIEQFDGFFALSDGNNRLADRLRAPVERLANWQEINRSRIIKQADVLMIPFLFPDAFSKEVVLKNFRYYAPLTDHGSSLSLCVHAAIAADLNLKEEADRYWRECLTLDLQNRMGNTPLGIHLGSIGGNWQALVFHFLKRRSLQEVLSSEEDVA